METLLKDLSPVLQLLSVMAMFALLPFMFVSMTSFLRYAIVFGFLKQALGAQQIPPPIILVGLSVILTFYTMGPTFQQMYEVGSKPYQESGSLVLAISEGSKPLKEFMLKQTREEDLRLFMDIAKMDTVETVDEIPTTVVIPAFIISELRAAFIIGFLLYVPFIIIDMVVSSVLMSMGMMMLPPTTISMPFKILLFILADGWNLVIGELVRSFNF